MGRLDRREKKITEGGGEVLLDTSQGLVRETDVFDQHALDREGLSYADLPLLRRRWLPPQAPLAEASQTQSLGQSWS